MVVVTPKGEEWPSFQQSLGEWLTGSDNDRFFVRWLPTRKASGTGAASYLLYKIIPQEALQYLHEGSPNIVPTLIDVVTGVVNPIDSGPMQRIIDDVRNKVYERDAALRPSQYGKLTVGTHIEPHLLDAMRRLVVDGTWKINTNKSRLWYGDEGLFLVWKTAAKEIQELLNRDGITGIPQDAQTLLDLLLQIEVFQCDSDGSAYWTIFSPLTNAELLAVKFASPLTILGAAIEEPEKAGSLLRRTQPKSATAESVTPVETTVAEQQSDAVQSQATGEVVPDAPPVIEAPAPTKPNVQSLNDQEERSSGAELPSDLVAKLTPLTRDVLAALLEDHRSNKTKGATGKTQNGFAIGVDQLSSYGADATNVIGEFHKSGWLYQIPEKPNKKIHQVEINQKELSAVIIKIAVARDLGFIKA